MAIFLVPNVCILKAASFRLDESEFTLLRSLWGLDTIVLGLVLSVFGLCSSPNSKELWTIPCCQSVSNTWLVNTKHNVATKYTRIRSMWTRTAIEPIHTNKLKHIHFILAGHVRSHGFGFKYHITKHFTRKVERNGKQKEPQVMRSCFKKDYTNLMAQTGILRNLCASYQLFWSRNSECFVYSAINSVTPEWGLCKRFLSIVLREHSFTIQNKLYFCKLAMCVYSKCKTKIFLGKV